MDALAIVYPQYWFQLNCDVLFVKHLKIMKVDFSYGKTLCLNKEVQVLELFDANDFDHQHGMFKLTMKLNGTTWPPPPPPPFVINPLSNQDVMLNCDNNSHIGYQLPKICKTY
jgi:hypothetical protein